jgi:hypothetical protein
MIDGFATFAFAGREWTEYPGELTPTREQLVLAARNKGAQFVKDWLEEREERIVLRLKSPYYYGMDAPDLKAWGDADRCLGEADELLINGGNRAGKTEYAVKRMMQTLCENPGKRAWSLHTTAKSSIQMVQSLCFKYMPPEWRNLRKSKITNVQYSQKGGFTEGTFVLPNGSQCWFMNYQQERNVIEGGEIDFAHADELVPLDWVETLRYRLVTRRGKLLITFTPVDGYTGLVKHYLSGMRIVETLEADLMRSDKIHVPGCPPGHMPYVARCRDPKAIVMWFHSKLNPFNPYDSLKDKLHGRSESEVKLRAYGWAENMAGSQFPRFGHVHIVDPQMIPEAGQCTAYMSMDPGSGRKNNFILWARVDAMGRKWIHREWPDWRVGDWALVGDNPDGDYGPGSTLGSGQSVREACDLIDDIEGDVKIEDRWIDPRSGNLKMTQRDGGKTLIELFMDEGVWFSPAVGLKIHEGVAIINDWLAYDPLREVGVGNQPQLYVSSECRNLIFALREWTGRGGEEGATKDPIDALRYLSVMDPVYIDRTVMVAGAGGSY